LIANGKLLNIETIIIFDVNRYISMIKKKTKGEIAKEKILNATLCLIADNGLENLSHRIIAKKAGVLLSLTSYYFNSLDNLIVQAFKLFVEKETLFLKGFEKQIEELHKVNTDENQQLDKVNYIKGISETVTTVIDEGLHKRRKELSIECNFFFGMNHTEQLNQQVQKYSEFLWNLAENIFTQIDSKAPNLDAQLIISAIRDIEFACICGHKEFDFDHTLSIIHHLLSSLTNK